MLLTPKVFFFNQNVVKIFDWRISVGSSGPKKGLTNVRLFGLNKRFPVLQWENYPSLLILLKVNYLLFLISGQRGSWRSSNPAVIKIDSSSGVGVAVGPGTATLYHDIAGKLETQAEVSLTINSIDVFKIINTKLRVCVVYWNSAGLRGARL